MKIIFYSLLCFFYQVSLFAYEVDISHFDGQYTNGIGSGEANTFSLIIDERQNSEKIKIHLEHLNNNQFLVQYGDDELILDQAPIFLNDVGNANWKDLNLIINNRNLSLNIKNAYLKTNGEQNNLNNLAINCPNFNLSDDRLEQHEVIIMNCLNNSSLNLVNFESKEFKALFHHLINDLSSDDISIKDTTIGNIALNIKSHKLNGSIKVQSGINATVKLEGETRYDSNNKTISIRIDKAKVGILNVTGKFFNELKNLESDNVTVQRPYILIKL